MGVMSETVSAILDLAALDGTRFSYCVVAVLAGAYLKGYTGFGASMLWMTSLSLVLPPLQVVPMVLMFEVVTSIALLPQIRKEVRWRSIGWLLLATWVATRATAYKIIFPSITWLGSHHSEPPAPSSSCS